MPPYSGHTVESAAAHSGALGSVLPWPAERWQRGRGVPERAAMDPPGVPSKCRSGAQHDGLSRRQRCRKVLWIRRSHGRPRASRRPPTASTRRQAAERSSRGHSARPVGSIRTERSADTLTDVPERTFCSRRQLSASDALPVSLDVRYRHCVSEFVSTPLTSLRLPAASRADVEGADRAVDQELRATEGH